MASINLEIDDQKIINIDREQIFLRTIINNPFCYYDAAERINEKDFYYEANRVIWRTIDRLIGRNVFIDLESIRLEIAGTEDEISFAGVQGIEHYFSFSKLAEDAVKFETRAEVIPILREQIKFLKQLTYRRQAKEYAFDILCDIQAKILLDDFRPIVEKTSEKYQLLATQSGMRSITMERAIDETIRSIDAVRAGHISEYVSTGIRDIDEKIGGFRRGWEYLIGALTNKGKTALMTSMLERMIGNSNFAGFSLEQEMREVCARMIAKRAKLPGAAVFSSQTTAKDYEEIIAAAKEMRSVVCWLCDDRELTIEELRTEARAIKVRSGLDVIFVDYLQELDIRRLRGEYPQSEEQKVSRKIKGLRALAKELNIAVIVFTQYTKQARDGMEPLLDWLPYSSALQQTPDMIMSLWTPLNENGLPKEYRLNIKKNRGGAKDFDVILHFEQSVPAFYSRYVYD